MAVIFVPAGLESVHKRTITLWSKPNQSDSESSVFREGMRTWHFHDHDVCLTSHGFNKFEKPRNYTKATSVLGPVYFKSNGFKIVLVNNNTATVEVDGRTHFQYEVANEPDYSPYKDAGLQVICDSGGFQLFRGKVPFVDPEKLGKNYNECATIGMDLDIPDSVGMPANMKLALARIQAANYEVLKSVVDSSVHLCLVGHGKTGRERVQYFDTIGRTNPQVLSVAGLQRAFEPGVAKELQMAEAILASLQVYPNVKYVHCLGTTSVLAWFVYSLIEHTGQVRNIGADSVSFTLTAITGSYSSRFPWKTIVTPKDFRVPTKPPCSCPVCSVVDDLRVVLAGRQAGAHNCLIDKEYVDYLYNMTGLLLKGEIPVREFLSLTSVPLTPNAVRALMEYVQECKVKFKYLPRPKGALFQGRDARLTSEQHKHFERIIHRYEKYHGKKFYEA